jgi:hypothetical protein
MDLHHWEQGLLGGYQTKQQALYSLSTCLPLPCYFIFSVFLRVIIAFIGFEPPYRPHNCLRATINTIIRLNSATLNSTIVQMANQ